MDTPTKCLRCSKNLRKFSSTKREFLNDYKRDYHLKCWIENKKDKYLLSLIKPKSVSILKENKFY